MKVKITVQETKLLPSAEFKVIIEEGSTVTEHAVQVDGMYVKKLCWEGAVANLVKKSFEFLLERESKESILREFNLRVISDYFPEYEKEIKGVQ